MICVLEVLQAHQHESLSKELWSKNIDLTRFDHFKQFWDESPSDGYLSQQMTRDTWSTSCDPSSPPLGRNHLCVVQAVEQYTKKITKTHRDLWSKVYTSKWQSRLNLKTKIIYPKCFALLNNQIEKAPLKDLSVSLRRPADARPIDALVKLTLMLKSPGSTTSSFFRQKPQRPTVYHQPLSHNEPVPTSVNLPALLFQQYSPFRALEYSAINAMKG